LSEFFSYILDRIVALVREEDAQDGFEYMLIVGGVSVAVILGVLLIGPDPLAEAVCTAIGTIDNFTGYTCTAP
jgi:hypothetical protein